jgi:hypothetical protein
MFFFLAADILAFDSGELVLSRYVFPILASISAFDSGECFLSSQ